MAYSISDVGPAQYFLQQQGLDEERKRALLGMLTELAQRKFQQEQAQYSRGFAEKEFAYKQQQDAISNQINQSEADARKAYYNRPEPVRAEKPPSLDDQADAGYLAAAKGDPVLARKLKLADARAPKEPDNPVSKKPSKQAAFLRTALSDLKKQLSKAESVLAKIPRNAEKDPATGEKLSSGVDPIWEQGDAIVTRLKNKIAALEGAQAQLVDMDELPEDVWGETMNTLNEKPVSFMKTVIPKLDMATVAEYRKQYPGETEGVPDASIMQAIKEYRDKLASGNKKK